MATDWLGQEYDVGDTILYTSGSKNNMVLAEVVKINPTTVVAKILKASRWDYHPTMLIDCRTGKQIYGYSHSIHIKREPYYRLKATGEIISSTERFERNPAYAAGNGQRFYKYDDSEIEYVPRQYWDYVQEVPAHVTFYIKDNITKVPPWAR